MGNEAFALEISPVETTTGGILLRLRRLARLIRLSAEICVAVALIAWLFARVPFAVRASAEILRRASTVISSPPFVFLLGNAIVGALLSRFRRDPPSSALENGGLLYEELRYQISGESTHAPPSEQATDVVAVVDEIVFQDKEMIVCERKKTTADEKSVESAVLLEAATDTTKQAAYRRSRSELKVLTEKGRSSNEEDDGSSGKKFRRSKSADECRKGGGFSSSDCSALATGKGCGKGEEEGLSNENEDGLSNDEFRRTIESFIARQVRFHRQESLSVVLEGQA